MHNNLQDGRGEHVFPMIKIISSSAAGELFMYLLPHTYSLLNILIMSFLIFLFEL